MKIKASNCEKSFFIDKEDFSKINQYKSWRIGKNGYVTTRKEGILLHRLLMNAKKGEYVDHINHNILDNRKSNLRICTNASNNWNKRFKRFVGVAKTKRNRLNTWRAYITVNKKWIHLGYFKTELEGAIAFNKAVEKYRDGFAYKNVV